MLALHRIINTGRNRCQAQCIRHADAGATHLERTSSLRKPVTHARSSCRPQIGALANAVERTQSPPHFIHHQLHTELPQNCKRGRIACDKRFLRDS